MVTLLFPGRHHMLTKFQHDYLRDLIKNAKPKIDRIIFAVTSANHENTRRNPVPLYLRVLAIDKFARGLPCSANIYPIPDIKPTPKFAKYVLSQISYEGGGKLTPENTFLACSTPNIIKMFKKLGFKNFPVELIDAKHGKYCALRPYEVTELLVKAGKNWREDTNWKRYASEATQQLYFDYALGDLIVELFRDSLVSEDADITQTRDYVSYAKSMDNTVKLKFDDIEPFVVRGKIVDAGCSTGALVNLLAKEFTESDIIGIEATRKFYEFCKMQDYGDAFVFFYRRNVIDQNFKVNTINTFIYSSVMHEIYSYLGERALNRLLKNIYVQLQLHGRIIIRDVVGPDEPNKIVCLELNDKDGKATGKVETLSTYAKFFRFVSDFKPREIKFKQITIGGRRFIKLRLLYAYEFMSKMCYADNWDREMHETFGFYSFDKWKKILRDAGFRVVAGSKSFKNPYIINNMYEGRASIYTIKNGELNAEEYPPTNMILVGEKD